MITLLVASHYIATHEIEIQSEDGFVNDKGIMWDIFYGHSVVGNNTYSIYTKMGGGM